MFMFVFSVVCIGLYPFYCLMHWIIKGVPCLSLQFPSSYPFFIVDGVNVISQYNIIEHYQEMKAKGYKFAGVVTSVRSVLIVKDLKLIRDVLIKHKDHFDERGFHYTSRYEPPSQNIATLDSTNWRMMRSILNPKVLHDNLKSFFTTILNVVPYLIEAIEDCALEKRDIDIRELFSCFTTDIITYYCYKVNCYSYKRSSSRFCKCDSDRLSMLGLRSAEENVSRPLYRKIRKFMTYRENGDYKHINFIPLDFFMKDWSLGQEEHLQLFQMVGKSTLLFYYSFDTSSTTLNFAIYELCQNPNIQNKVRCEINNVLGRYGGVITWESLRDMRYLDQVIDETLRLYPPATNLVEQCQKGGYKLGNTKVNIFTDIVVPLFSLHRDPDYFPDPEKFDPERFRLGKYVKGPRFYMPYGEGLREYQSIQACTIQTKIALVQILRNFKLSISSETLLPLHMKARVYVDCDEILYINAEKI